LLLEKKRLTWVTKEDETLVNTDDALQEFLPKHPLLKEGIVDLACDMEGLNVQAPPGSVAYIQITIISLGHTWVFEVTIIGRAVF
jgi:hypothetical protein